MLSKLKKTPYIPPLTNAFTLIEVLLGVALTLIVVSVAGFGLVNILRNEYKTNAESEIRNNLNRATEFISDETRRAERIVKNEDDIVRPDVNRIPSDAQMILALELPNYHDQIIYYTTSASNPWIGPRVLNRWGPPLDSNGNYELVNSSGDSIPNGSSEEVSNANWVHSALVDMMSDYGQVPDTDCDGWNRVPAEIDYVNGFFVCVNQRENLVRLRLTSEIPLTSTTTTRDGKSIVQDKAVYSTDTKVFVRSFVGDVSAANVGLPFVIDRSNPNRPVVIITRPTNVGGREEPPNHRCNRSCDISTPRIPDGVPIPTVYRPLDGVPGDYLNIEAGLVNTILGNTRRQRVEILTNRDALPSGITLTDRQVLYVLTDIRNRITYNFVISFN
jgi:type II secretory pathway pseudopilin PulG